MKHLIKNIILDGMFTVATAPLRVALWVLWVVDERKRQRRVERRTRRITSVGGGVR